MLLLSLVADLPTIAASTAPWWGTTVIAAAGVIVGVLLTLGGNWFLDISRRKADRDLRLLDRKIEAYVGLLSAFDDYLDANERSPNPDTWTPERMAIEARANSAVAAIDLLAPAAISELTTVAFLVSEWPLLDPGRIKALEALVTAMRKDLGNKSPAWKQVTPPGLGAVNRGIRRTPPPSDGPS